MQNYLQFFVWLPILLYLTSLLIPKKQEEVLFKLVISGASTTLLALLLYMVLWIRTGAIVQSAKNFVFFQAEDLEIFLDFQFDRLTAVFALIGNVMLLLISGFSRYYLHRDPGYKRFFTTVLLFFAGYNLIVFAGNFETLFIGWEIIGVCSFLLIAFYRERYLPVKNSLKVLSVFRLGDICLIAAMWMSHHLWHENITFIKLNDAGLVRDHLLEHNWYGFFIASMILIAAAVKSAQLPFSSWLPRAMEGPTTSSALFYGSLSVHVGVFLLLRTFPYWESMLSIRILVACIGLSTALVASAIANVQPTVKTQIAYASCAQIGLMFVEVALGWHTLALIHFAGNALLRSYQLLVSPSVLGYSIHNQFFEFVSTKTKPASGFRLQLKHTVYLLSITEWGLDRFLQRVLWNPFKAMGNKLFFINNRYGMTLLMSFFAIGVTMRYSNIPLPQVLLDYAPNIFSLLGLLSILVAFAERGDARRAWSFIVSGQLFITLSITLLNEDFGHNHILWYLGGAILSALLGYACLQRMLWHAESISLNQFHGHIYEHPKTGTLFLLACLGFIGLPFTPTFIGIDLLFSHIHKHEELMIISTLFSFIFLELAILRIYARLFLGQHAKNYHPVAYRSS